MKPLIPKDELGDLILTMSQRKIGEKFGVSQHAICKWLKFYGINSPRKENYKYKECDKTYTCINCGEKKRMKHGNAVVHKRRFCNATCHTRYRQKEKVNRWLRGEISGDKYPGNISSAVRWYLLKEYNYKCSKCGWGEKNLFTGKIPLHVHHLDGHWDNTKRENLTVLCPNCHSLTENFGSRNVGEGKIGRWKLRRQRRFGYNAS